MSGSRQTLVIFTRYPEPGRVKTRLIPALGPAGAAALHDRLTRHTLRVANSFLRTHRVDVEIQYAGGDIRRMRAWLGRSLGFCRQRNVYGHLVAIKVSVKCRANKRRKLYRKTLNEFRFKCLHAQTMQCRSAV